MTHNTSSLKPSIADSLADLMRLADAVCLLVFAVIAYVIRHQTFVLPANYVLVTLFGTISFLVIMQMLGAYRLRNLGARSTQALCLLGAGALTLLTITALFFFLKAGVEFSRIWLLLWVSGTTVLLVTGRLLFTRWLRRQMQKGAFLRHVVLFGDSASIEQFLHHLHKFELKTSEFVGVFLPEGDTSKKRKIAGLPVLGRGKQIQKYARENPQLDDVLVTMNMDENGADILELLQTLPCNVKYVLAEAFSGKNIVGGEFVGDRPVVTVFRRAVEGRAVRLKRTEDVVLGSVLLIPLLPVMVLVALILRIEGHKSVIFTQARGGFQGNSFTMYKFRSMKGEDKKGRRVKQATQNDPRITPFGRILRKTSLDELPQIFNVLKGDMSLIGPRPHALSHDNQYRKLVAGYAARNRIKPGMTGWAQVNGWRGETDTLDKMARRVEHDIYYIENWSLWLDAKILVLTALVVFFHKNAY